MPNAREHRFVAAIAGGAVAFYCAADCDDRERLLETAGGFLTGMWGATLPDWIDPPTHPNHRSIGHGVVGACCCTHKIWSSLPAWQTALREMAQSEMKLAVISAGTPDEMGHVVWSTLYSIAAGAIPGLLGGYLSHLALDATTRKSIPLVG